MVTASQVSAKANFRLEARPNLVVLCWRAKNSTSHSPSTQFGQANLHSQSRWPMMLRTAQAARCYQLTYVRAFRSEEGYHIAGTQDNTQARNSNNEGHLSANSGAAEGNQRQSQLSHYEPSTLLVVSIGISLTSFSRAWVARLLPITRVFLDRANVVCCWGCG
jgi:hypothetical protein